MSDQYIPPRAHSAKAVAEDVEMAIGNGTLAPGDRLAPIRATAAALGLAPTTVADAYRTLARRGLVIAKGRAGTFVAPGPGWFPPHPSLPDGLVDLASGNPDPALLPDLRPYLARLDTSGVLYGANALDQALETPLRRLLSENAAIEGVEQLAVVNGALDGVERVLAAHLRPGDAVAVEAPGWPALADLVTTMGLRPTPVAVDDRGMVPSQLARVIDAVAAVLVTPRMQNPTGAALDASRADELRSLLATRPGIVVIEDDHGGLISGVELQRVAAGRGRWAYVHSFSKSLGPDLRLACLTGDELTVRRVTARQSAGPGWVSHLMQRLVASVLVDPTTPPMLEKATTAYAQRRAWMLDALAEYGIPAMGRTGLAVWATVPDEHTAVTAAAESGYAITAGSRWRMGTTPTAVRISIGRLERSMAEEVAAAIAGVGHQTSTRIA